MTTNYNYEETDPTKVGSSESPAINKITNILIDILNQLKGIENNTEGKHDD